MNNSKEKIYVLEVCKEFEGLKLKAVVCCMIDNISIYLGGGKKPHIGSLAISQPRDSLNERKISCTTSVINVLCHKDDVLSVMLSENICRKTNAVVAVSSGVHVDDATAGQIDMFINMTGEIAEEICFKYNEFVKGYAIY